MGLSYLAKECKNCPFVEKCDHKQMEALAYLPDPMVADAVMPASSELTQPILRETVNIIVNGEVVKIYKDDLEKELYKSLYSHLGLNYVG